MSDSFSTPMRSSAPSGSPTQYTSPEQIDSLLESSNPGAVVSAGQSYQKFASAYEKIAGELLAMRTDLHEAWDGKDAAAAQAQLREVWSAATTMHKTAGTFGVAIERHGSEYLAWYKNNKPPSKDLAEAQSWMTGANERISQSWSSLPPDLSTTLPPGAHEWRSGAVGTGSSGGGGSNSSGGASSSADGAGGGGAGPSGHSSGHHTMRPGDGTGTQLADFSPVDGGGNAYGLGGRVGVPPSGAYGGPYSGGGLSVPSGGLPGAAGTIGPGGVLPGGFRPTGSGLPPDGQTPGMASRAAAAEEAQAAEAGAGQIGAAGSGAARHERERARRTWLVEDEEVWAEDIESTPHLIGTAGGVTETPDAPDGFRETGASHDDEDLTDILVELDDLEEPGEPERGRPDDTAAEIAELRAKLARLEQRAAVEREAVEGNEDDLQDLNWIVGDDE